ncbi:MAG: hypothetical protein JWO02_1303 [Solirubrobacterales bacterium]|nr:hypothetical protein [Solirubrobacterales bacterium]
MAAPTTPPAAAAQPRKPTRIQRARRVQRLVVTWTVIAFVAAWGGIYVQMRAGSDPALGSGTAAATSLVSTTTPDATTTPASGFADTTQLPSGTSSQTSQSPSPVTTSQS